MARFASTSVNNNLSGLRVLCRTKAIGTQKASKREYLRSFELDELAAKAKKMLPESVGVPGGLRTSDSFPGAIGRFNSRSNPHPCVITRSIVEPSSCIPKRQRRPCRSSLRGPQSNEIRTDKRLEYHPPVQTLPRGIELPRCLFRENVFRKTSQRGNLFHV